MDPRALTAVSLPQLRLALRRLHRDELQLPLNAVELARNGLQQSQEALLDVLRGLDKAGAKAVLVAVIAERLAAGAGRP